jgi:hypothetical protein
MNRRRDGRPVRMVVGYDTTLTRERRSLNEFSRNYWKGIFVDPCFRN